MYADDITLFVSDVESANVVLNTFNKFSEISGLKLNRSKTEVMWIGSDRGRKDTPLDLIWKNAIKITGIVFSYSDQLREQNYIQPLNKLKLKLNIWKMRDLSLLGKIQIVKTYGISQLLFVSNMIGLPKHVIVEANKYLYGFIWNGQDKVKRASSIANYSDGGLKMMDLNCMLIAQKVMWIKRYLLEYDHPWKTYFASLLRPLGENYILNGNLDMSSCNYFPLFYKEILDIKIQ